MNHLKDLDPALITDSRLMSKTLFRPVLEGPREVLYKQWKPTSASKGAISFSCQTPIQNAAIDRNIQILVPCRVTCSAVWDISQNGQYLVQPNKVGIRSYPVQKALDNLEVRLNTHAFRVNLGEILSGLEHLNTSRKLKLLEYSKCSTYGTCQSQKFSDMNLGIRSGLSTFEDSISGIAPQNFPFTVYSNFPANSANSYTATSIIDFTSIESLFISPCYFGDWEDNFDAFAGITNMDVTLNFIGNNPGFRMIAIDNTNALGVDRGGTITGDLQVNFTSADNFTYSDLEPKLLVQYIKPQYPRVLDKPIFYPYWHINNFTHRHPNSIASYATDVIQPNELLLPKLPSKIYIWARKPSSTFSADPFTPDCFLGLENLELSWNNRTVLSEAHKGQLYDLSVKNGLQLEYAQWSGLLLNKNVTSSFGEIANQFGGTGSIFCVDPLDLGIDSQIAYDPNTSIPFGIKATCKNLTTDPVTPELVVVILYDGLMKVDQGTVTTQLGIANTNLAESDFLSLKTTVPKKVGSHGEYKFDVPTLIRSNLIRRSNDPHKDVPRRTANNHFDHRLS